VHGADREVVLPHLLGEPVHLPLGVAENDSLWEQQGTVETLNRVAADDRLQPTEHLCDPPYVDTTCTCRPNAGQTIACPLRLQMCREPYFSGASAM
jgi:hypothetical protein